MTTEPEQPEASLDCELCSRPGAAKAYRVTSTGRLVLEARCGPEKVWDCLRSYAEIMRERRRPKS
jgi:hypothetical protein